MTEERHAKVYAHVAKTLAELAETIRIPDPLETLHDSGLDYVAMIRACIALDILCHLENAEKRDDLRAIIDRAVESINDAVADEFTDLENDIENYI